MIQLSLFSKWRWKYLVVLLALGVVAYFSLQRWRGPQLTAEVVQRRDFVQSVGTEDQRQALGAICGHGHSIIVG